MLNQATRTLLQKCDPRVVREISSHLVDLETLMTFHCTRLQIEPEKAQALLTTLVEGALELFPKEKPKLPGEPTDAATTETESPKTGDQEPVSETPSGSDSPEAGSEAAQTGEQVEVSTDQPAPSDEQPSDEQPSDEQPSHEQPSHEQPSHEQLGENSTVPDEEETIDHSNAGELG